MIATVIAVAIVVVVLVIAALIVRTAQQRKRLRGRFGPEYDRTVEAHGNRREAERELNQRRERVEEMDIRPLAPAEREPYRAEWILVQERFVDNPETALSEADQLVKRVMADRGYEAAGFRERVADLSVGHARTLENYRLAHGISARAAQREASTEELRQGMVHYRTLFDDLLGEQALSTGRTATGGGH